jgi:hypothetical protein
MSFEKDMRRVEDVLERMHGKFAVANLVDKPVKSTTSLDSLQMGLRNKLAGPDASALTVAKVPIDGVFYRKYGKRIAAEALSGKAPIYLKCFDFNAYIFRQLLDKGFSGTIKKGLVGVSTLAGHEFLVLYHGSEGEERYLDVWSHLQTGQPALCEPADYGALLAGTALRSVYEKKGVSVKTTLK